MAHAERPATPVDEIAARREWRGATFANGILTPELVDFCQRGMAIILAACREGSPIAGRGFACRIDETGGVRILLQRKGHEALLAALQEGARIAATFTQPPQHRSIQLKGKGAVESRTTLADGVALSVQSRQFRDRMMQLKYSDAMSAGYCFADPEDLVAIDFVPDEAFVQTPGPSAGSELKA